MDTSYQTEGFGKRRQNNFAPSWFWTILSKNPDVTNIPEQNALVLLCTRNLLGAQKIN